MGMKSTFHNEILEEEVSIEQPKEFVAKKGKDLVWKLHKSLYGLKKELRAWYERLHSYLIKIGYTRISDNNNIYLKVENEDKILIVKKNLMI